MTKTFPTTANFNRPLYQSQDFIRTLNIFPYYLSSLLLIQHKNFNFKAHFQFSKKYKGGILTKTFPAPANFNWLLYQSQDFIRTLNIFPYYLSSLLLIQPKSFNFKAHFLFSKKCKGGTLTKTFPAPANFKVATVPKSGLHSNFKYFSILFEVPTIDSAQKF